MTIRIKKISPVQAGKMLAAIYSVFCVVMIPIMLLIFAFGPKGSGGAPLIMVFVMPVLYIVGGLVGGIVGAFVYNLVAGWIGGFEIEYDQEKA
jgi:hypothetical protein